MTKLYVTEYASDGRQQGSAVVQAPLEPPLAEQVVDYTAGVAASSAFQSGTTIVRLHADSICSVEFGDGPDRHHHEAPPGRWRHRICLCSARAGVQGFRDHQHMSRGAPRFSTIIKDAPAAQGVHVTTAIGNSGGRKRRFQLALGEGTKIINKRDLKPHDDKTAKTPFLYDANALGDIPARPGATVLRCAHRFRQAARQDGEAVRSRGDAGPCGSRQGESHRGFR